MKILNERVLRRLGEGQCPGTWVAFQRGGSSVICLPSPLWTSAAGDQVPDWLGACWSGMGIPTMVTQLLYRKQNCLAGLPSQGEAVTFKEVSDSSGFKMGVMKNQFHALENLKEKQSWWGKLCWFVTFFLLDIFENSWGWNLNRFSRGTQHLAKLISRKIFWACLVVQSLISVFLGVFSFWIPRRLLSAAFCPNPSKSLFQIIKVRWRGLRITCVDWLR